MTPLVLSIEDTAAIRRLIRLTLEYEGFAVAEADSGLDGLAMARRLQPDLILLDVRMPGISGIAACAALRDDPRLSRVPVVMLSALGDETEIQAALAAGASAYIVKPFLPLDLVALVRGLIGQPVVTGQR